MTAPITPPESNDVSTGTPRPTGGLSAARAAEMAARVAFGAAILLGVATTAKTFLLPQAAAASVPDAGDVPPAFDYDPGASGPAVYTVRPA